MSDEFDREAERERLRKKYEREEQDRESYQQMSELLLQGATMTDRHCPECSSPLFRDDDGMFCPKCDKRVVEHADEVQQAPQQPTNEANEGDRTTPEPTPQDQRAPAGDDSVRANIQQALERSAVAAAESNDPRQVRAHLEAATAALEALAALDRTR